MENKIILFLIRKRLKECIELLQPKLEYYLHKSGKNLPEEELNEANIMFSLFDRIKDVLTYYDRSVRNNSESNE